MPLPLLAFLLTLLLLTVLQCVFKKLKWLDKPELYGYLRKPVPYGLGIVFFLVFLILGVNFLEMSPKLIALFGAGGLLTLTSFLDDRYNLPAVPRFLVQILCAAIVVLAGIGVPAISNPFGATIVLDSIQWSFSFGEWSFQIEPLADLIALLWIVFVINAMNWLDGAPGMVSGISTIACAVIFFLASISDLHVIDQADLSVMALIVGASSFAFLFFDFPKPRILMGDSGTMFLGLMIAVMAIFSGGKLATAFIVLAIPILDALWTIVRRILKKQSPFKGDFQHFHHELMRAGLTESQVNGFYYVVSLSFGISALYLESLGKFIAILSLFALMVIIRLFLLKSAPKEPQ
jgi:UDP-GlcNAc:undecaprenyl-phosphate GlcNAc-1-phosphate transferase